MKIIFATDNQGSAFFRTFNVDAARAWPAKEEIGTVEEMTIHISYHKS